MAGDRECPVEAGIGDIDDDNVTDCRAAACQSMNTMLLPRAHDTT